ncbi:MAG: hypothetical protein ABI678_14485 [Kofleriaceae bacterium]
MRTSLALVLVVVAATLTAAAAPAVAPMPAHYTFRIKTVSKAGATAFVPVGEVTRAPDGTITAKGIAAPSIDKLADGLVADWGKYKVPGSIEIVRYLPNGSYMRNTTTKRTVTFTPKDTLFKAAVLNRFLATYKYEALGMSTIDFIIHDTEDGPDKPIQAVHDGGSSFTNFRKNTELEFNNGHRSFYIYAPVRPTSAGAPGPVSPTDKKLALSKGYDRGGVLIAWIDLTPDGSVTIHPNHTADLFETQVKSTLASDHISVAVYDAGEYKYVDVAKTAKRFFEAAMVSVMEANGYDVTPGIDPGVFR